MILELSENSGNVMLDALARVMDGGFLEILSDDQRTLATLSLSSPAALPATDSKLTLAEIFDDVAVTSGIASAARILGPTGNEIFVCDVSDASGDAVIQLNSVEIHAGGLIGVRSFVLSMP